MPAIPGIDFSGLSDEQLSQMLIDYGVDVGPINPATRKTYERKLFKLKTGQASQPSTKYEPVDDDDDDDDDADAEDEEVQIRRPEVRAAATRQPTASVTPGRTVMGASQARYRGDPADFNSSRVESRPYLSASKRETMSAQPTAKAEESTGLPLWVKLVAIFAIVVLVYLIYCNMEPQAVSNIPGIQNRVEV